MEKCKRNKNVVFYKKKRNQLLLMMYGVIINNGKLITYGEIMRVFFLNF